MVLTIGEITLDSPIVLAPLAGYSDLPFRLLCREYGAGMCVSEMISCHGLVHRQGKTLEMLRSCPQERPVSFQLFGADPKIMAEAATLLDQHQPDLIDINMGCPVKKVTKRGAGAALMDDIHLAEKIIRKVVSRASCPVSVKIRSGVSSSQQNGVEFARMVSANGAAAITVHGRTWSQAFGGRADWDIVARIKQTVNIPVIGNGDITDYNMAMSRREESGCDGIMIGRGALGNPWVFSDTATPVRLPVICRAVARHFALIETYTDKPDRRLGSIKNHLGRYFKGFPGAAELRRKIYEAATWQQLKDFVATLHEA